VDEAERKRVKPYREHTLTMGGMSPSAGYWHYQRSGRFYIGNGGEIGFPVRTDAEELSRGFAELGAKMKYGSTPKGDVE